MCSWPSDLSVATRVERQVGAQERESRFGTPFPGAIHIPPPRQLGQPGPLSYGARQPSAGPGRNPHLLIRSDPSPAGPRDLEAEPLVLACGVWGETAGVWGETAGDPFLKGHLGTRDPGTLKGEAMGNWWSAPPLRLGWDRGKAGKTHLSSSLPF